jgi:6-phosphofructokinase 1
MDTAAKVARLAYFKGLDLVAVGVAKTIDNDVGDPEFQLVDHTPGYGSVARFWACNIQNINEENNGISRSDPVMVVQVMGRETGFIPAAVRLGDPNREMPLQIYMPESGLSIGDMTDMVNDQLKSDGRVIVVVSEGFKAGELGDRRDSFGHTKFSASRITTQQLVVNHLNKAGLVARGVARGQTAGIDQRATIVYASTVDLDEAYRVGENAVRIAVENGSGFMSTIIRHPGSVYRVGFDKVPLEVVANSERQFPSAWIAASRVDVTDDFVRYARPLIGDDWVSVPLVGGIQRFARLRPAFADQKLPAYVPVEHRN